MTFLDMTLFFDKDKMLQWRPYRKLLNHFERIPWISAHPVYMKKGTFLSELSRVAMLSSQYDMYVSACREVADIYIARGYPPMLIASWLRENYAAHWDTRLNNNELTKADMLALKSEYNIPWDFFNVQLLAECIKTGWIEALRTLSFGNKPADLHPSIAEIQPKLACSSLIESVDHGQRLRFANDWTGKGLYSQYLWLDKLGLLDRQVLVAEKRTRQLIDLTAL